MTVEQIYLRYDIVKRGPKWGVTNDRVQCKVLVVDGLMIDDFWHHVSCDDRWEPGSGTRFNFPELYFVEWHTLGQDTSKMKTCLGKLFIHDLVEDYMQFEPEICPINFRFSTIATVNQSY